MDAKKRQPDPTRRRIIKGAASLGVMASLNPIFPAFAWQPFGNQTATPRVDGNTDIFELTIARTPLEIGGQATRQAITVNGAIPGPLLRWKEGRNVELRVTNQLDEDTSIHWHGILLPPGMDGVPGVSFPGIPPGETFVYRFPVRQSGTYWYHSHSGLQEQLGHYAPLIVEPASPEHYHFDRDYAVVLSDWTFQDPHRVLSRLKKMDGYYNYQQRTVGDFFQEVGEKGWGQAWMERSMWLKMRMSPRDLLDVTGSEYLYLINGRPASEPWTALFQPGEKVRLRFINAAGMTYFDVRIPGLRMTVVQADGQDVAPVPIDEFRIGVAETYDVIVEPEEDRPYAILAETMDRSGHVYAALAPREGMLPELPATRRGPVERDLAAIGHGGMHHGSMGGHSGAMGKDMPGMDMSEMDMPEMDMSGMDMSDMDMSGMDNGEQQTMEHSGMEMKQGMDDPTAMMPGMKHDEMGGMHAQEAKPPWVLADRKVTHGANRHGPGAAMIARNPKYRLDEPGVGLTSTPEHKVLVYDDLRSLAPWPDPRAPSREIELHLTGNMERYMWSFDGKKFTEAEGPIRFNDGERLRLVMVNDTMMDHPIHLHGMWMELENRHGDHRPRKHTLSLKPGEMLSALITADAPGNWAFHCHLIYHMKAGMFRVVSVS